MAKPVVEQFELNFDGWRHGLLRVWIAQFELLIEKGVYTPAEVAAKLNATAAATLAGATR
jgi:hypothetical protein